MPVSNQVSLSAYVNTIIDMYSNAKLYYNVTQNYAIMSQKLKVSMTEKTIITNCRTTQCSWAVQAVQISI